MRLPRHAELWFAPYIKDRIRSRIRPVKPRRAWIAITDHFEPLGMSQSIQEAMHRVTRWRDRWPRIAEGAPLDVEQKRPQYTFFYPQEEYNRELLEEIAEIVRLGVADVEVHLHHDHDSPGAFVTKVADYCRRLTDDHGLLRKHLGRTVFGFIHGNWALDNSRPDGRWCGVTGEIALLRELGCYADFTMPSLPSPTQSRILNRIYWCTNNPDGRPRSFDHGVEATIGGDRRGDLLMITGPVGVRFGERIVPRIETGEIAGYDLPTAARARLWFDIAPRIGEDIFIKLYSHGASDTNLRPLLEGGLSNLFLILAEEAHRRQIDIHWVSAWQMYKVIAGTEESTRLG